MNEPQYINGRDFDAWTGRLMKACQGVLVSEVTRCEAYFDLGDAYNDGERDFGESAAQALPDELPMARKSIQNAAWIARRIPKGNRSYALPWSHFREVAGLEPPKQVEHLHVAQEENLSTRELHRRIKGPEDPPPLLDEPPPVDDPPDEPPEDPITTRQREPRIEIPKILKACHGAPCMLDTEMCKGGPGMPCHSNFSEDGKGRGVKAHDLFVAIGCADCHRWLDEGDSPRGEKRDVFHIGMKRTWFYLWTEGVIGIAKQEAPF